jgi:hypothetical protein
LPAGSGYPRGAMFDVAHKKAHQPGAAGEGSAGSPDGWRAQNFWSSRVQRL